MAADLSTPTKQEKRTPKSAAKNLKKQESSSSSLTEEEEAFEEKIPVAAQDVSVKVSPRKKIITCDD